MQGRMCPRLRGATHFCHQAGVSPVRDTKQICLNDVWKSGGPPQHLSSARGSSGFLATPSSFIIFASPSPPPFSFCIRACSKSLKTNYVLVGVHIRWLQKDGYYVKPVNGWPSTPIWRLCFTSKQSSGLRADWPSWLRVQGGGIHAEC